MEPSAPVVGGTAELAASWQESGFECDDVDDCIDKCWNLPESDSRDSCHYKEDLETDEWCCCWDQANCDFCGGDGGEGEGCGPEGESEGGDSLDGGRGDIWLECDSEVQRGFHGGCEVRTQLLAYRDSLEFHWQSFEAAPEPEWEQGPRWRGKATVDRKLAVHVIPPRGGMRVLSGKVTVSPRPWQLEERNARSKPKWVDDIPGWPTAFGLYKGGVPRPTTLFVGEGSGPWKGSYYVSSTPSIADAEMYLHKDMAADGPEYPIDPKKDSARIAYCKPNLDGYDSLGVYHFNAKCNEAHKRKIEDFRQKVIAHERRHETSLNECIRHVNRWGGLMAQIEKIVFDGLDGRSDVEKLAERLWTDSVYTALRNAKETAQGAIIATIWDWRPGPTWNYGVLTKSHIGTEGCPGI